jgi:hypothetical protein
MGALKYGELVEACISLGIDGPYSFEPTGEIWTGTDESRNYQDADKIRAEAERLITLKEQAKQAALDKLVAIGLTVDELRLLGL